MHRVLGDKRSQACRDMVYPVDKYPTVSLVIVFHEEARSTLIRTVWSALDNSPKGLLVEVGRSAPPLRPHCLSQCPFIAVYAVYHAFRFW